MFGNLSYSEYFHPSKGDPHTRDLPFLGYPLRVWTVCGLYLLFVLQIGPQFMKNRPAFNLKRVLFIYNLLQIVLNFIIGYKALQLQWVYNVYDMGCCRSLPMGHEHKSLEIWTSFGYYVMKYVDLLDTVFFVLRKSWKQISFLHVYHHVLMINALYVGMHFFGSGGEMYAIVVVNSFIHCIMYGYYLITAALPSLRGVAFRFKKYLTLMQLIQFLMILVHNSYPLMFRADCKFSRFNVFNAVQSVVMIVLFSNFYIKAYTFKKSEKLLHNN